jgi:hypothetical protein
LAGVALGLAHRVVDLFRQPCQISSGACGAIDVCAFQ